jgi:hypothetical protein
MKKFLPFILTLLLGLLLSPPTACCGENHGAAVAHSKDFEKMKGLVSVWQGTTDMGKGPQAITVTYELTSAGNAVLERLFVGMPHEMATVYYDYAGKLNMTHYCSLGNQPHMDLMKSGGNTMQFVLSKKNPNLASLTETHMHSLKIDFDGKDSITQTWSLYEHGRKKGDTVIKLTRTRP